MMNSEQNKFYLRLLEGGQSYQPQFKFVIDKNIKLFFILKYPKIKIDFSTKLKK